MKLIKEYYGDCEGPLGFPMISSVAKDVEKIIGGLSADCKEAIAGGPMRVVKMASAMDFVDGERADISFVTTDSVDRDGEVMLPGGADWKQFRKNPIVTFAHKYDQLPPGRSLWLQQRERDGRKGWLAKTQYIGRPADWPTGGEWLPDAIWHYVRGGNLPGKSIGFIPTEMRSPEPKEIEKRPELAKAKRLVTKWLALEYAVAPVPCNPDALVVATAKARREGMEIPDLLLEEFGMVIPETIPNLDMKPYPNEHSARLHSPEGYIRFRRENDKFGSGIHAIWGVKEDQTVELQAIRFDASKFTVAEAKKWLADHDHKPISFEPATGEERSLDPAKVITASALRKEIFNEISKISVAAIVKDAVDTLRGRV